MRSFRFSISVLVFIAFSAGTAMGLERYDGRITEPQLGRLLSRAVTMEALLADHGNLDDEIRFLKSTGTRFAGRTIYCWGTEQGIEAGLIVARQREQKIHAAMPELMLQAAIFEIVSTAVEKRPVPRSLFEEFKLPPEQRNFSYEQMLFPKKYRNNWGKGSSVPDITQVETQMWFYDLATRYIDAGVEAIHFGQVDLMGERDKDHAAWDGLLARVRAYALKHARRGIVLCDAHVPRGGIRIGQRLLFDFHSFPMRIAEAGDDPSGGVLRKGYRDSLYGRSMGGTTPSGWTCEHLPYLVELDNFGRSHREGKKIGGAWVWGYDEITWFAHLSHDQRGAWLKYANQWITDNDPAGHFEMPGSRTISMPVNGADWYWASNPSSLCPTGFGDEAVIRQIWQSK